MNAFLKLREAFGTFPKTLQIYAIFYQGQVYFEPVRPHIVY